MLDDHRSILTRIAIAKAVANNESDTPPQYAARRWGSNSTAARLLQKMAIDSGTIGDDADFRAAQRGFIELLKSRSLIGRISGWRRAEFHTPTLRQTASASAQFVAQGKPFPVTTTDLTPVTLDPAKVGGIFLATDKVVNGTGASFESALTQDLVRTAADTESTALVDPNNSGGGGVPASLIYGVTPVSASGTDADSFRADMDLMLQSFSGDLESAVMIMHPFLALRIMMMQHPLGQVALTIKGGDLFGLPVYCSSAVSFDSNASAIILLDPGRILLAQGDVEIDRSKQATIQVSATPDDPVTASTVQVSLWQHNLIGFLVRRAINWEAVPGAVSWIHGADYGAPSAE